MMRALLNKLFSYNKPLVDAIDWHPSERPMLFKWHRRGSISSLRERKIRRYAYWGSVFLIAALLFGCLLIPVYVYIKGEILAKVLGTSILMCLYIPILIYIYFPINNLLYYSYQINAEGIEMTRWQEAIPFALYVSKFLLWVLAIACIIGFIASPSLVFAGLGGGAATVATLSGAKVFSKKFQDANLDYAHIRTTWDQIDKIEITEPLGIIYIWAYNLNDKKKAKDLFYLFYTADNKEPLIALIKQKAQAINLDTIYSDE